MGIYFLFLLLSLLLLDLTWYLFKVLLGDGVIVVHLGLQHFGVLFALIIIHNILIVDAEVK